MNRIFCTWLSPRDRAASVWPPSMDWMPERMISHRYAPEFRARATTPGKEPFKANEAENLERGQIE